MAKFERYVPVVPEELSLWVRHDLDPNKWLPFPSQHYWQETQGVLRPDPSQTVIELAEILGGELAGQLGVIDITAGCLKQHLCQTCVADSPALKTIMPLEVVDKLLSNPAVVKMLNCRMMNLGVCSEPSAHPQFMEMTQRILNQTAGEESFLEVKINFRKEKELGFKDLLKLGTETSRLLITVSLPLNSDDQVQQDFYTFKKKNETMFDQVKSRVFINDLRQTQRGDGLAYRGRVLAKERLDELELPTLPLEEYYVHRGIAVLLLNPEGLWLAVATDPWQAHTERIYYLLDYDSVWAAQRILINSAKITRSRTYEDARSMMSDYSLMGKCQRPLRLGES